MNPFAQNTPAADVVAHDVTPLTLDTDPGGYSRLGWLLVLLGLGGFLLWALLAPLDKGVPLSGTVAKEGNRKSIQHQSGGTVQSILVREGDHVRAGQVLVRMNDVAARSQAELARGQYFTARAVEARLRAELAGRAAPDFGPELEAARDDPRVAEILRVQRELFGARQAALRSELASMDESVAGLDMQAHGIDESRDSKRAQLAIMARQLDDLRDLANDGYVARNRVLDQERNYEQIKGAMAEDGGNLGRTRRQASEIGLRRSQRVQEYQKEVRSQLSDAQREAEGLASRMKALDFDLANAEVKSPVDGVVVGMTVFTNGGVVGAGAKMMEVVPSDDGLVVEGQLPVNLIDRVRPELPVELIFSAFNANRTPHIPGSVAQVAADRMVDEHTGQSFYKVRVRVTAAGAKLIARHKMEVRPGMPVELFVKTGERTMMSYLLKPVFDRAGTSMTEE